jgi:hypothetical protein
VQWLRQVINFDDRRDLVPSLNGVRKGMTFRNKHTGHIVVVDGARLGGWGVYSGHDSVVVMCEHENGFGLDAWTLFSLRDHWKLVEPAGENKWRVLPHPLTGQSLDRKAWCSVIHERPQGDFVEWRGAGRTVWRLHWNRVLLRNGRVVATFKGLLGLRWLDDLAERFPDSAPGPLRDLPTAKEEA